MEYRNTLRSVFAVMLFAAATVDAQVMAYDFTPAKPSNVARQNFASGDSGVYVSVGNSYSCILTQGDEAGLFGPIPVLTLACQTPNGFRAAKVWSPYCVPLGVPYGLSPLGQYMPDTTISISGFFGTVAYATIDGQYVPLLKQSNISHPSPNGCF